MVNKSEKVIPMEDIIDRLYHGQLRPNENIGSAVKECPDKLQRSEQKLTETFSKEQAELYRELTIDQDIYVGMTNLEAFRRGLRIGMELMIAIGKGRIE